MCGLPMLAQVENPECLYLVGTPTDWKAPSEANKEFYQDWKLEHVKDLHGMPVYQGCFDIPAGEVEFRLFSGLKRI